MIRNSAIAVLAFGLAMALASCGGGNDGPADTTETDRTVTEMPDTGKRAAIAVTSPKAGDTVTSPVTISGTANVFEANVSIAITDAAGTEVASAFATASCGSGCRGDFSEAVEFEVGEAGPGVITVFESSAEDGSRQNIVEIPVTLEP